MTDLALYIHWPFCISKCPYCDFNSHVRKSIDEGVWQQALELELDRAAAQTADRTLVSIFFGGGTPSLMPPKIVAALITKAHTLWQTSENIEITLEANPNSVEVDKFASIKAAGVNRVSLGIQSLVAEDLKKLGRAHSINEAKRAISVAQDNFARVSIDLIYARQEQALDSWQQELVEAQSFGTEHMSLYQLTIEPGTAYHTLHARGDLRVPNEDLAAEFYEQTQTMMDSYAMPAYEISNHAKLGQASRHNLQYWQYQDYIGIGPGAHGRITIGDFKYATKQYRAPETWLQKVFAGSGEQEREVLTLPTQQSEALMMGLRLVDGVNINKLPLPFDITTERWQNVIDEGYAVLDNNRLRLTAAGRIRLNAILAYILADS